MRKILFGLALLIGLAAQAQTYTDVPGKWRYFFLNVTDGFAPPQDTLSTASIGSIAVKNGVMYVKGVSWIPISGGGGSGVWGSITGLIGNQTDLVNLLGAKMDSSKRTMDTLYAITDSTFGYYVHNQFRTFKALGAIKSFNGRNGAIILTQADVVTGLGYTPLAPADTVGRWVSLITNNATDDSIIYYIGNTRYAIKDNGSGGGTDSALAALYGLKIITFGTTRYIYADTFAIQSRVRGLKIADSLAAVFNASLATKKDKSDSTAATGYLPVHRLADSAAVLRSLASSGFDSSSSQGGGFHTRPYYDAIYLAQQSAAKNQFLATPTNVTGAISLRTIDPTDIPNGVPLSKTNATGDFPINVNGTTGHISVDTNTNDNSAATRGFVKNYLNKDTTIFATGVSGTTYTNSALIGKQIVNFVIAGVSIPLTSVSGYTYATFNNSTGAFTLTNGSFSSDDMIQVTYVTGATIFAGGGGGGGYTHSYQFYTAGSTVTVTNGVDILDINPASSVSTLSVTLPATPNSNNEVTFFFGGTISGGNTVVTSLTVLGNTGQTVLQATSPTVVYAGESISYQYFPTQSMWKRKF